MIDSAEAVFRVNDGVAKRVMFFVRRVEDDGEESWDAKALGKMEILADAFRGRNDESTTTNSFRSRNETMVVLVNADEHERETIASSEYFNHAKSEESSTRGRSRRREPLNALVSRNIWQKLERCKARVETFLRRE